MNDAKEKPAVLITGCTTGSIGYFLAREFAARNYHVYATSRRVARMGDLSTFPNITLLPLDVTSPESIRASHAQISKETGGRLDILYHNAGYRSLAMAIETTHDEAFKMFNTNLFGILEMNMVFADILIASKGKIVFTGSVSGYTPHPSQSVYNSSKAAVELYARTLRIEMKPLGVKVVMVNTAGVNTGMSSDRVVLSPDSNYKYLEDKINQAWTDLEGNAMDPKSYANAVVSKVYLQYLEAIDVDSFDVTEEDLYDWTLEPLLPVFLSLESKLGSRRTLTLHDYLNPITFYYKLHAVDGILVASHIDGSQIERRRRGVKVARSDPCFPWPSFLPSELSISNNDPKDVLTQFPRKVLVDGKTTCYFKQFFPGDNRCVLYELNNYLCIDNLQMGDILHIPRLIGLVQAETDGSYLGLLLSYIDCGGMTLQGSTRADTPMNLRQRWADQVSNTLKQLHKATIVWGDVKAANVLIDTKTNAWVIGFGGGFTNGWVEKEKAETVEGDLQGLGRIVDYIFAETG